MKINTIKRAKEVLDIEIEAIRILKSRLGNDFTKALEMMFKAKGRIVVSGMGKTGIIAQKLSATLASTGTPSLFLHTTEAVHGDLGRVTSEDVVIIISNSGSSEELKQLMPLLKKIGSKVIALTGNLKSVLSKYSDAVLDVSVKKEACPLGLAPTASTTAALAMADALAVCLLELKGFEEKDFAFFHPGGALGKRLLLKVSDIMRSGKASPVVDAGMLVSRVLLKITQARAGSATIVDKKGSLVGIFTDGDLRRHLEADANLSKRRISEVMTKNPLVITADRLAAEGMRILEEKKIDEIPVVDKNNKPVGLLDIQDLLRAGLV
ncbi:MAG: KpsF/GutQ family sugar-phosphate isomerase [Candidatus Omnitrophota bacterium]|nr:KpsF/GutQ family sugar-phosphate isomerase [Candidatus Omnitrophota bacterium]MBU1929591.1 KpsF/GutQ family sugar-phosphate isomerase [Candidatus Omnitrophota bacterium]MBU2034784.1 KpsF/GutQ family sugar-phosphate isomerase [Candidatus Omnitrophota bacterium]MBU2221486.1 KpsF/GutQ family sugar-phosphate isomerase [Candidatus Omnitrophota bacterium]MBU2257721.1 KpsF/GutQ family sugar-phosphate isomerase [Candidatus Omnitrophota bacterium]